MTCIAIEVFSYTFFGNRILTATDSLTNSTYFSIWYEMPVTYKKHVIMFMERMKRNSVLMAGKLFPMNLTLFTTVRISVVFERGSKIWNCPMTFHSYSLRT